MKLEKAIELLNDYKMQSAFDATPDFKDALKLGIEALKLVKKCRHSPNSWFVKELPGETED